MKLVRVILLLVVVAGLAAMVYYASRSFSNGSGAAELRSSQPDQQRGVRVEEKYGVTSEQVGP
jgi:hypothetical protein